MNDLMSMGIHRIWKRIAVQLSNVRKGEQVLDSGRRPPVI